MGSYEAHPNPSSGLNDTNDNRTVRGQTAEPKASQSPAVNSETPAPANTQRTIPWLANDFDQSNSTFFIAAPDSLSHKRQTITILLNVSNTTPVQQELIATLAEGLKSDEIEAIKAGLIAQATALGSELEVRREVEKGEKRIRQQEERLKKEREQLLASARERARERVKKLNKRPAGHLTPEKILPKREKK